MKKLVLFTLSMLLCLPAFATTTTDTEVTRSLFCNAIAEREPADAPESISVGQQTLYFFTEVLNAKDQALTHRWSYNGIEIASVPLKIGADRWRTWSTKQIWHLTAGTVKVEVVDSSGAILSEKEITLQ